MATADGDLGSLWVTNVPKPADVDREIVRRLDLFARGSMLPFAAIERSSGVAVGMTSYMEPDADTKRLEIGSRWYAARVQRTGFNASHFLNAPSRRAIERPGAKLDGVLRHHKVSKNGTLRDTCVSSIVASEWPAVRALLDDRLRP